MCAMSEDRTAVLEGNKQKVALYKELLNVLN
jgi:hypothetical protein